jgi:hypothetical protein
MRKKVNFTGKFATISSLSVVAIVLPMSAFAQEKLNNVTFDLQDAPIRSTIEAAFKQAGINNYIIDNNVVGFVTLKITEQPFENALKLIMRAASVPLTYTKENGVWIVKPRAVNPNPQDSVPAASTEDLGTRPNAAFERINLTYLDPMDLSQILGGIINVSFSNRAMQGGGGMGGMGGGMGGMGGGMGGMGGGMGGMMGGGMGGMGGGMGGMGGGMGGMGGGGMMGGMGGGMGGMGGGMGGGMMGGMGGFGGFGR